MHQVRETIYMVNSFNGAVIIANYKRINENMSHKEIIIQISQEYPRNTFHLYTNKYNKTIAYYSLFRTILLFYFIPLLCGYIVI